MQVSIELLALLVTVLGMGGAFIYGYGRLGARVDNVEKALENGGARMDKIESDHKDLDNHVGKSLSFVRESLARIEGALGVKRQ